MKIEELSGEASIRNGTKELLVPLVGDEREAVTKDVYDADERKLRVETEKAHKNKVWNDEIKNEDLIIHNGCMKLKGGVLKKIETKEYFFWDAKKVYIVRADTGEVIGVRPIEEEETFQDFTDPDMQVKPDDIPDDFKQLLLSYVPPPEPVETEYVVVEDEAPAHICCGCLRVDEQPACRGEQIKFANDDPEAAVLECSNFKDCGDELPEEKPKKKRKSKNKKRAN